MKKQTKSVEKLTERVSKVLGDEKIPTTANNIPKEYQFEDQFNRNKKPTYTKKGLKKKIRVSKLKRVKKIVVRSVKNLMLLGGIVVGIYGSYNVGAYIQGKVDKSLDFETREYYKNPNIEAGHYNRYPIKVCVSDKFTSSNQRQIVKGINSLDKDAVGLSFDVRVGNGCELQPHEIFVEPENLEKNVLGRATLNPLNTYGIRGHIALDQNTLHIYGIKSTTIHELAHVIGLAHSKNITSLMYPISCRFDLSKEDIKNINTIYPAAQDDDFER